MLIDNQNGTVTDTKTGLMWMKETIGPMNWNEAIEYCKSLHLAELKDWRLPTIQELFSLINFMKSNPAIDDTIFPNTVSSYYWSSTTGADYAVDAWRVYFHNGNVYYSGKYNAYYVRAVRTIKGGE